MLTAALRYIFFTMLLCLAPKAARAEQPTPPPAAQPPQPVTPPPTAQPPQPVTPLATASAFPLSNPNCFSYRTSLPGEKFYFDKINVIYTLINTGIRDKINFEVPLYKHLVVKIDTRENSLIIIKELTASMPAGVLFLPYGNPPSGWSGVLFEGGAHACRYGMARFFSSTPRNDKKISAFEKKIALVASLRYPRPFDIVTRRMLDMDVRRLQFRKLPGNVPLGELPLYSDPRRRALYTFTESPSFRGIIDRSTRHEKKLEFPLGSRILQQGNAFALSMVNRATNVIEIREYPKWSGARAGKKRYRVKLPPFYNLSEAQVAIDFRKKIVAIGGAELFAKRKWRKIFFIDYRRGKRLAELELDPPLLADTIAVDPFGLYMAINVVHEMSRKTTYLALFDLTKRKLYKISLRPTARRKSRKATRP